MQRHEEEFLPRSSAHGDDHWYPAPPPPPVSLPRAGPGHTHVVHCDGPLPAAAHLQPEISTPTFDDSIPPEAMGARQLVHFVFRDEGNETPASALRPAGFTHRPKPAEVGLPLPLVEDGVNHQTERRLVYFGRGEPPRLVLSENSFRSVAVTFKPPPCPSTSPDPSDGYTSFGVVLGYSDDDTMIVWHNRGDDFASMLPIHAIATIHRANSFRCNHCGQVQLRAEGKQHLQTHKRHAGLYWGVFTDDEVMGHACGDTGLMQHVEFRRKLGEGGQGTVELFDVTHWVPDSHGGGAEAAAGGGELAGANTAFSRQFGELDMVVVKRMDFGDQEQALAEYRRSVRLMGICDHPHLVEYLAVQVPPGTHTVRIFMPYYAEDDLASMVRATRGVIPEHRLGSLGMQLAQALAFLHERNPPIVHGDVKVENVLLYNRQEQVVLMDFDASREIAQHRSATMTRLGTEEYKAPETVSCSRLMPESDMWGLGMILYVLAVLPEVPMIFNPNLQEMVFLNIPEWATVEEQRAIDHFVEVTSTVPPARKMGQGRLGNRGMTLGECVRSCVATRGYSRAMTDLIVDLLSYDPYKRPRGDQVVARMTDILTDLLLSGG